MKHWQKILETLLPHRAELARVILTERGIETVVMSKRDSSYLLGKLEVYVHENNFEIAQSILYTELPND